MHEITDSGPDAPEIDAALGQLIADGYVTATPAQDLPMPEPEHLDDARLPSKLAELRASWIASRDRYAECRDHSMEDVDVAVAVLGVEFFTRAIAGLDNALTSKETPR